MKKAFYKSEYGDIYYELSLADEKPMIIFIHGVGMDHHTFEMQVEAVKSDYSVLVWVCKFFCAYACLDFIGYYC